MNTPETPSGRSEKDIFFEALQKTTPEERAAFLDEACGRDPVQRTRVEALLANHFQPTDFMQDPAVEAAGLTLPAKPAWESPTPLIGRYKLLEKIGEGGFGEVWMAEQREPVKRRVALKILKPGMDSRQVVARFEAERQALAMMDHPNIARIYDAGTTDSGRPYFVMELVRGTKITEYCDQHQLTTKERLNLFIQVCQAIQHAHQKGIIHRDIKPSNVLVTVNDGAAVPKVIDFGIAKATQAELTDKTVFTQFQQFIGTPAYISPEQAEMSSLDIDTRADIYSLGVLLYELLVGQTPFDAREMMQGGFDALRRIIREREPQRPSTRFNTLPGEARTTAGKRRQTDVGRLVHQLQGDLDWIVMKCLEKDRTRRYETANGLAADLKRHLDNEPVVARPPSTAYRIQKAIRRNKLAFGAAAVTGIALLAGLMVAGFGWRQSQAERDRALIAESQAVAARQMAEASQQAEREQRERAERGEKDSRLQVYAANMNLAQQAWEQGNTRRIRRLLEETRDSEHRGFEWYYWQRQARPGLKTFRGHSETVTSVAYAPDGKTVATSSDDGTAKVWDIASGREVFALTKHSAPVKSIEFSPDARRLLTSSLDSTVRVWDSATGAEQLILRGHTNQVFSAAFSPDGRWIVSGGVDQTVRIWSAEAGQEIRRILVRDRGTVWSVAISPEGDRVLSAHEDGSAVVWDLVGGKQLIALGGHQGHQGLLSCAAFSPDGRRIATASMDGNVRIWDATQGRELLQLPDRAFSLDFSPDGQRIATAGEKGAVRIWNATSGALEQTLEGGEAGNVDFSSDGRHLVTGNADHTARLWSVTHRHAPSPPKPLLGRDSVVAFSPDRQRCVAGGTGNTARVWEVGSGQELTTFSGHSGWVVQTAFSPDGDRVATASWDNSAKVWEAATGRELLTLPGHRTPVYSVAFSADGRRLATGDANGAIRHWDARSGATLLELYGHRDGVYSLVYSPDGRYLATGGENGTVMVWSAATGEELLQMSDLKGAVWRLDFSEDGERLVASTVKGSTGVWRVSDGKLQVILEESRPSSAVVFSPDGRRIVTAGFDRSVRVWEAISGKQLTSFPVSGAGVDGVAFSPDGRRLLGADKDGQTQVWEAATPDQVAAWDAEERADQKRLIQHQAELEAEKQASAAAEEKEIVFRAGLTALPRPHQPASRRHPFAPGDPSAIRQWLVLGPFPFDGDCRVHTLAQQLPGEARLRPRAGESPAHASGMKWTPVELPGSNYLLDFLGTLAQGNPEAQMDNQLGYAVAYIRSDSARTNLTLLVGSDDTARIYLNEQEVYRQLTPRPYRLDADEVLGISLKAGVNVLVLKVANARGLWSGSVRLLDADGRAVKGIQVTLDPERTN